MTGTDQRDESADTIVKPDDATIAAMKGSREGRLLSFESEDAVMADLKTDE